MSLQKLKVFPLNKSIKLNVILTNNLEEDIIITKIKTDPKTDNIKMNSNFELLLPLNNPHDNYNLCTVIHGTEFVIPLNLICIKELSSNIGELIIYWKDKGLNLYDDTQFNCITLSLPDLNVKLFDVVLKYDIPRSVSNKNEFELKIIISNQTEEYKRIVFLTDTSINFVISGFVKKKILISPLEEKYIVLNLMPLAYGKLKLPPFKIMEYPLGNNSYDNKIYSIYNNPDSIQIMN